MGNDEDFQAFQKKLPTYTSAEDIVADLKEYMGNKKAISLGQKLFQELELARKTPEAKDGLIKSEIWKEIENSVSDPKNFQTFQDSIQSFKSV